MLRAPSYIGFLGSKLSQIKKFMNTNYFYVFFFSAFFKKCKTKDCEQPKHWRKMWNERL